MTRDQTVQLPLSEAYLCVECGTVGNDAMRCLSCANACGLLSLANVLNREPEPELGKEVKA